VAAALTRQQDFSAYLPTILEGTRECPRRAPLFPGYLFICSPPTARAIKTIQSTAGVWRVLGSEGAPQAIPAEVIHGIRANVTRVEAQGGLGVQPFDPGQAVRVAAGPLHGLDAIFLGQRSPGERVRILIEFLGAQREAEVPLETLERARAAPQEPRPRRSRGRGRPIHA